MCRGARSARAGRECDVGRRRDSVAADREARARARDRHPGIAGVGHLVGGLVAGLARIGRVQREVQAAGRGRAGRPVASPTPENVVFLNTSSSRAVSKTLDLDMMGSLDGRIMLTRQSPANTAGANRQGMPNSPACMASRRDRGRYTPPSDWAICFGAWLRSWPSAAG